MGKYIKVLLLIFICIGSIILLNYIVDFPLFTLILFFTVGGFGLYIQRGMYKSLLEQMSFIDRKLKQSNIQIPPVLYKIRDLGMELTFIFLLATVSINPVTDFIDGQMHLKFSPNLLFLDLSIVSLFFANIPIIAFTCYSLISRKIDD